jgi:hypothetical protein
VGVESEVYLDVVRGKGCGGSEQAEENAVIQDVEVLKG